MKSIRRWRKMTWVVIVWCALILIWAIAGAGNAANNCVANATSQLGKDACNAGAGIGVAIILLIGFFGFVFFSLIWFMTRPRDQPVAQTTGAPPGWYPDPNGVSRWWDGQRWGEQTQAPTPPHAS